MVQNVKFQLVAVVAALVFKQVISGVNYRFSRQ
jgi:hypothetical protein